jgi:hypothetical protein
MTFLILVIEGPTAKFTDSPSYSKLELCRGVVTVSLSKDLPWQAVHFLTMLHPLLENMLQTICHKLQEDCGAGSFDL